MKLAVFGASVSNQNTNREGEVTGYSEVFRRQHASRLGVTAFQRICYTGNRLSDAGLIRLNELCDFAPDICVFEPLIEDGRRGIHATETELRFIYRQMLMANILPVSFLLPVPQRRSIEKLPNTTKVRKICEALELPMIVPDISALSDDEIARAFRDIHTRPEGAAIYAEALAQSLETVLPRRHDILTRAQELVRGWDKPARIYRRELGPGKRPGSPLHRVSVEIDNTGEKPAGVKIVHRQIVGPHAPVVGTQASGNAKIREGFEKVSVWDPYSHYDRETFVLLTAGTVAPGATGRFDITVLDEDPDYATCRREDVRWPPAAERCMITAGTVFVLSSQPFTARSLSDG